MTIEDIDYIGRAAATQVHMITKLFHWNLLLSNELAIYNENYHLSKMAAESYDYDNLRK